MEEKRMSPILIVILSVLGTCLVGFVVWYGVKYFKNLEEPEEPTPEMPVEQPSSSTTSPVGDTIDFPKESDDGVVIGKLTDFLTEEVFKTNFKNLEFTKNGNKIILNCENYMDKVSSCGEVKININNDFSIMIDTGYEAYKEGITDSMYAFYETLACYKFFKANNYYIVYTHGVITSGTDNNKIQIYKGSNIVSNLSWVKSEYWVNQEDWHNSKKHFNIDPVIVNNVLHLVQQANEWDSGDFNKLMYETIDLSKDIIQVKLVKEFTTYFQGEYQK